MDRRRGILFNATDYNFINLRPAVALQDTSSSSKKTFTQVERRRRLYGDILPLGNTQVVAPGVEENVAIFEPRVEEIPRAEYVDVKNLETFYPHNSSLDVNRDPLSEECVGEGYANTSVKVEHEQRLEGGSDNGKDAVFKVKNEVVDRACSSEVQIYCEETVDKIVTETVIKEEPEDEVQVDCKDTDVMIESEIIVKTHTLKCQHCEKSFTGSDFQTHLCEVAEIMKCNRCRKWFSAPNSYYRHLSAANCNKLRCPLCKRTFPEKSVRDRHMVVDHYVSTCDKCGLSFESSNSDHSCKPLRCHRCQIVFRSRVHYNKHMETHTGGPWTCHKCKRVFVQSYLYSQHLWECCKDARLYFCTFCSFASHCEVGLRIHVARTHLNTLRLTIRQERWTCATCGKKFNERVTFNRHILANNCRKLIIIN